MAAHTGVFPPQSASVGLYSPKSVLTFGILQVGFGIALIITDIVNFSIHWGSDALSFSAAGSGFYTGAFFIITGSFGIAGARRLPPGTSPRSRLCLLITSMVLSILSTLMAGGLIIALASLLVDHLGFISSVYCWYGSSYYNVYQCAFYLNRIPAMMGTHLAFQGLMWIFCLGQSISAGINICKMPKKTTNTQVVYVQPGYGYPQGAPGQPIHFVTAQPTGMGGAPVLSGNPAQMPSPVKS
ncbi:uncharacterized protein LOC129596933 [Paramacrobiotus metropolitanus]|uniref:uncharacterized protein LOC129596933 n=1 Tax=Paramacrobiotus metropolitanus TaxID=2943436 RepID=UPI002445FE4B|nr:uncharacterized protein LOC129596933 [Paramacrobiotus metropolitanus]